MKRPASARLSDEMADLLIVLAPEAAGAAFGAMGFPCHGIEMAVRPDRRYEFIAVVVAALGKIVIAGQLQPDFFECHS